MEVMIDIETLATSPNSVILCIGALKFDRKNLETPTLDKFDSFYQHIATDSCLAVGMEIDKNTLAWWEKQQKEIRDDAFGVDKERRDLKTVLTNFKEWIGQSKVVWSHGATFDCVILQEAYKRVGLECPWKFWDVRDTRTLYDLGGITNADLPTEFKHNAVHDCYRQIVGVHKSIRNLMKIYTLTS
jgi:DNA polymerase III alpha subunit (gram-positive type)